MSADLVARLRHGCVMHPRRWSGDTHDDLGGSIREAETDALMAEAAELVYDLRAQLEAAEQVIAEAAATCGQALARAEAAEGECARLLTALGTVADWDLPETGETWPVKQLTSPAPTPQQISDYLFMCERIRRKVDGAPAPVAGDAVGFDAWWIRTNGTPATGSVAENAARAAWQAALAQGHIKNQ